MSEKLNPYKISAIFLSLLLVALPCYAQAQETNAIEDVTIPTPAEIDQMESVDYPEEVMEDDSVVVNPIEEAAPIGARKAPVMPQEVVEPMTPLQPPAEAVSETSEEMMPSEAVDNQPKPVPYSGQYYDADSIGGNSAFPNKTPRQVDPKYEPGSRFVVVEKGASATSTQAQLIAAQRALKLERYASALDMYEALYKKTPNSRPVLMGLAIAQQNNGLIESAIATYEELLSVDPNNVDATVNMLGLMKARYPAIAYRRLRDLWEDHPENAAIAAQLGLTSAAAGNTQDALRYLGIASSLEPQNASHFYNMAVLADRAGAKQDAIELYQKALEVDITHASAHSIPREDIYDRLAYLRRS